MTKPNPAPTAAVRRPLLLGLFWGALAGLSPALQAELDGRAKTSLGLGLGLTYASVGLLVGLLPRPARMPPAVHGLLAGVAYSVPGAVFTAVPYPLREDAPRYWREFAAGGPRAFALTLLFGGLVGLTCGLARGRR